jgi:hypothetical protein
MEPLRPAPFLAALTALAAGGIHLSVAGPHLEESLVLGAAFIVTAWLQIGLGAWLWRRPTTPVALGLSAVHLASITTWAVSRTVGLPVGHAGPEPLGVAGTVTAGLGLLGVVALLTWVLRPDSTRRLPAAAALTSVVLLLGGASVAIADGGRGHAHGDEADHRAPEPVAAQMQERPRSTPPATTLAPTEPLLTQQPADAPDGDEGRHPHADGDGHGDGHEH